MSKRRPGLKPRDRDDWPTPWPAVVPLLKLLEPRTKFIEPCCGAGELVEHLKRAGHVCAVACDLPIDARTASYAIEPDTIFVTNLPWRRQFGMNDIIVNLSDQRPLWGLVYADWLFTSRATPAAAPSGGCRGRQGEVDCEFATRRHGKLLLVPVRPTATRCGHRDSLHWAHRPCPH